MKIPRPDLLANLSAFATSTGGLVTGRPGVGKTHSVWACETQLRAEGYHVLVVAIDRMEMQTSEDFHRLLRYEGPWLTQLRRDALSSAKKRGVIFFDAYDAARDDHKRDLVLSLIQQARLDVSDICSTVVTVREFDAEKSPRLRKLFTDGRSAPPRFTIPPLTEPEVELAMPQVDGLREVYANAGADLRRLLHVPFFLWLVGQVWRASPSAGRFAGLTSEVQLLSLLWETRVSGDEQGTARDAVTREIAQKMVASRRLELMDPTVYQPALDRLWNDLRSAEIVQLDEKQGGLVRFSHNILFDYAASRLFRGFDAAGLEKFFGTDRTLPLFLRPSLAYYFTEIWHRDRTAFWAGFRESVRLHLDGHNAISRLIIPNIVISETREEADFDPWLAELNLGAAAATRGTAFILQAHRVIRPERTAVWAQILRSLSTVPHWDFAWDASIVANQLLDEAISVDPGAVNVCADAARNLLAWCWAGRGENQARADQLASSWLIPLVGKTHGSEIDESRKLLLPVLLVMDAPGFPVELIFRLCSEIRHIADADPAFAKEIYLRVFGYRETSTESTKIGSSVVVPLISNRRQDYEMCHYVLCRDFPKYLDSHPAIGTAAGLGAVNLHVRATRVIPRVKAEADVTHRFSLGERRCVLIDDLSHIWDESAYPDQPMALASEVEKYLLSNADEASIGRWSLALESYLEHAQVAALWRRLLRVASEKPEAFAPVLKGLLLVREFQVSADLVHGLGRFLEAAAKYLTDGEVQEIEVSLSHLAASGDDPLTNFIRDCRDRLLFCIPAERLQTEFGRGLRAKLSDSPHPPKNRPLVSFSSSSRPYTTELWLSDTGVDVKDARNRALWSQLGPFEADEKKWREANPPVESWRPRFQTALALWRETTASDADPRLILSALTKVCSFAAACARRMPAITSEEHEQLLEILLHGAAHAKPEPKPDEDRNWSSASWSPTPRTEAAQGLLNLYANTGDSNAGVAVEKLAGDPVPLVRFLIACDLWRLRESARPEMYAILKTRLADEPNAKVVEGLALSVHNTLDSSNPESVGMARALSDRAMRDSTRQSYHDDIAAIVTDLALGSATDWALALTFRWHEVAATLPHWLAQCVWRTQQFLTPRFRDASFAAAVKLQCENLHAIGNAMTVLQPKAPGTSTEEEKAIVRTLFNAVNEVVMRTYFALDREQAREGGTIAGDGQRRDYYLAIRPVLDAVVAFSGEKASGAMLGQTAHYFMQLLNAAVGFDPVGVMRYAAQIAAASKPYGYNLDSLAVSEVVSLVETILADHRVAAQGEAAFADLLALLDVFTEVGWPDALALVWRLDEIYR